MKSASETLKILAVKAKKILWTIGLHAFSLIIFFVFIDFIIGSFIFYKYVFLVERQKPIVTGNIIKFNDKAYQAVLGELRAKEQGDEDPLIIIPPSPSPQP